MKNLINVDKEVNELSVRGVQTWVTPFEGVRLTQRIQLGESYAVINLTGDTLTGDTLKTTADIIYKSELQKIIIDGNWVEVRDAVICRESDLKEEKYSDTQSNN